MARQRPIAQSLVGTVQRAIASLYHFIPRPLPTPGTGNYAFQPEYGLPAVSVQGAGIIPFANYNVLQPPQSYYQLERRFDSLTGGGTIAGSTTTSPLIDMEAWVESLNRTGGPAREDVSDFG
jgi:hypothetical protein